MFSLVLGLSTFVGIPLATVIAPQVAQASVAAGDVVFTRVASGGSHTNIMIRQSSSGTVTDLGVAGYLPDVSPDGSRIAYLTEDCYLAVVNSDGSGSAQLRVDDPNQHFNDCPGEPRWSPNGQWIAFVEQTPLAGGTHYSIRKIHADGSSMAVLADGVAGSTGFNSEPTWSPDSSKIAFSTDREAVGTGYTQLYIMNSDGTNQHRITASNSGYNDSRPEWSHNGSRIYFYTNVQPYIQYYSSSDTFATTSVTRASVTGLNNMTGDGARLSLDDTTLTYHGTNSQGCFSLFTMPVSGGTENRLTGNDCSQQDTDPVFVPAAYPTATAKTLVPLGDSVAAGEGIAYGFVWDGSKWVETGPDSPDWADTTESIGLDYDGCHQTGNAHGRLMYAQNYKVFNMACTGATTMAGILGQQPVQDEGGGSFQYVPPQLGGTCSGCGAVNTVYDAHNPDVVTVSITANDVNFAGWVKACYTPDALGCDSAANTNTVNAALTTAKTNLRKVLTELNRRAALAHKTVLVVVTNYHNPFPLGTTTCVDTTAWAGAIGITTQEKTWLTSKLSTINSNIASEVTYAQQHSPSLKVRLADISTAMNGHRYCDADPWIYGPSINYPTSQDWTGNNNPSPFHPTPKGQIAIYDVVKTVIAAG